MRPFNHHIIYKYQNKYILFTKLNLNIVTIKPFNCVSNFEILKLQLFTHLCYKMVKLKIFIK